MNKLLRFINLYTLMFLFASSLIFGIEAQIPAADTGYGNTYVTRWADDRMSAFTFSFDDGLKSQYDNARGILNNYNFKGSFFILPPYLTDSLPGIWRYGTWYMFQELANDGHEIGSHTLNHPDLTTLPPGDTSTPNTIHYELYQSLNKIYQKIENNYCISLAYPYGTHNNLVDSISALYYDGARSIGEDPNSWSMSGSEWFGLKSYGVTFDNPRNSINDDLDELNNFEGWIDQSIQNGTWAIQLVHEVVPYSELPGIIDSTYYPIGNEWLSMLCDWIKEKSNNREVWVENMGNVMRYMKERDSYSYNILTQTNSLIEINLTDPLDDVIFNYPLSAYISVPEDWQYVRVEQGTQFKIIETVYLDSITAVLADIVPDGGVIKLMKSGPSYISEEEHLPDNFILHQNYPNPFNPLTAIRFHLYDNGYTTLKIYDITGREICTLVSEELSAGDYKFNFNAEGLASGIYVYVLSMNGNYLSRKMTLLK